MTNYTDIMKSFFKKTHETQDIHEKTSLMCSNNKSKQMLSSTYYTDDIVFEKYKHIKTPDSIMKKRNQLMAVANGESRQNNFTYYDYSYYTFLIDSINYAHHSGVEVPFIPLFQYRPSFASCNKDQLAYYFYWRTSFLKGCTLEVSNSYLCLFACELMSYTFHPDTHFNISVLVRLYERYKDRNYLSICNYLPKLIADMLFEAGEQTLAEEFERINRIILNDTVFSKMKKNKDKKRLLKVKENNFFDGIYEEILEMKKQVNVSFKGMRNKGERIKKTVPILISRNVGMISQPNVELILDKERIHLLAQKNEELQTLFKEMDDYEESIEIPLVDDRQQIGIIDGIGCEEVEAFISSLDALERAFILLFHNGELKVKDGSTFLKRNRQMAHSFISDLNEKATSTLGDIFIELDHDTYSITEDFVSTCESIK